MRIHPSVKNVVWWKMPPSLGLIPKPLNLGDALSPFIVQAVLAQGNEGSAAITSKRLLAIGSILHKARNGDTIWGTGSNGAKSGADYHFDQLDVRAVRGPRTADILRRKGITCPEVYGDPAILLPKIISRPRATVRRDPSIIPHYTDRSKRYGADFVIKTVGSDFAQFVSDICSSPIVFSASLHGVIIAEAYGVPAVLVTNARTESLHKYADYYESTGREGFVTAANFLEARSKSPPALPDLSALQQGLIDAFPRDLWL